MKIAAYYYAGADLYHLWSLNCNNNRSERETAFGLTAPLICWRASNCERCQRAGCVFVQPRHPRAFSGDTHTDEPSPVGFINLQLACVWSHVVHNATCNCVNRIVCHTHTHTHTHTQVIRSGVISRSWVRASAAENDNKREGRTSQRRSEEETNERLVTRVDSVLTAEVTLRDGVYLWRRRRGGDAKAFSTGC